MLKLAIMGKDEDNKKNQELLGEKLFDIQNMIASTPSCLKIISADGRLMTMNQKGLNLIEAENLESVLGANVYDIVEESHRNKFIEFNRKICSGASGSLIFEIVGLKGTRRWMECYATPYQLSDGTWAHIAITNDISAKVLAEKERLEQKQALEETARLATLGQFVSGIAHEINNPMAIISAQATVLRNKIEKNQYDQDFFKKGLKNIEETVVRISKIISGLRTLSCDPNNEEKKIHNLAKIVSETLALCAESFRLNNIQLKVEIPESINLLCNSVQISQVLMNLLNNSVDAMATLENKWVSIKAYEQGPWINVTLTDAGNGIPDHIVKRMFDPFFTTKELGHGTG